MSSAKRNLSSTSVCTLDLACNLLRLKSFPSKRYLIGIPLSLSLKAAVSMAENTMLNRAGTSTQPCLTPFVTGNGSENSPSFSSWNCLTIAMNGRAAKLRHNIPKTLTIYHIKCFGKVNKDNVEVPFLFLAFLMKLPCCEDHVNCSPVRTESTLAFW